MNEHPKGIAGGIVTLASVATAWSIGHLDELLRYLVSIVGLVAATYTALYYRLRYEMLKSGKDPH